MDVSFVPIPDPHIADYIVIAIFLCICMGIGVYYGYQTNQNPTLENYFFGNRRLLMVPVAMSLFVTYVSAISVMGIPAEIYVYGIRIIYGGVAYVLSLIIANVTIVPLLYPLKLTSTYEYLQLRFNSKGVRTMGTMIGMLQTVFYMGITLYAPGLALQTVAGIPLWVSIAVFGLVCTIYTSIGGIKSVVWTDAFQCVMMFIGIIAVLIKGTIVMGTHHSVIGIATEGRRLEFFNFDPDPTVRHTNWGLWIGLTFTILPNWCSQASVQRILSLRSIRAAYMAFWFLVPVVIAFHVILGYFGILVYSYYNTVACDPVQGGFISNFNQLIPYFVLDVLRSLPGLAGIFISCVFSGALSTFSSGINALSANTVEDILCDYVKKSKLISQTFAAKLFVFLYGLGLAYVINNMPGSIIQMAAVVFGACGGPLVGLYFLGGMIPKANWIGAIVGTVTSLVFNMWIAVGSQIYGKRPVKLTQNPTTGCFPNNVTDTLSELPMFTYNITMNTTPYVVTGHYSMSQNTSNEGFSLYNVSYVWYGFIGFVLTLLIGTVVSLCTGGERGESVDARLIFPICRKLCGLDSTSVYDVAEMEDKNLPPATTESHVNIPSTITEHNGRSRDTQPTDEDWSVSPL